MCDLIMCAERYYVKFWIFSLSKIDHSHYTSDHSEPVVEPCFGAWEWCRSYRINYYSYEWSIVTLPSIFLKPPLFYINRIKYTHGIFGKFLFFHGRK